MAITGMTKYEAQRLEKEINAKGLEAVKNRLSSQFIKTDCHDVRQIIEKQMRYIERRAR